VLMDFPLRLDQVERTGIRELTTEQVRSIRNENSRYKLVCLAERMPDGGVRASVRPEQLPLSDPLAHLDSNSSGLRFDLDVFGLSLIEHEYSNGAVAPAYGLLADFLRIAASS
jgi:homoserine dehydrogenase